jgi:WD40 repeat protein
MLSASEDNSIKIWDIPKKKCIKTLIDHTSCVNALLYINNKSFASCSEDNFIFIWNVGNIPYNCKVIKKMNGHEGRINCMCNVDDIAIATGSNDKTIKIWNVNNCSCVGTLFGHNGSVNQIIKSSISDQERIILISVSDDKSVKIWNVNQRQCIGEIENAHIDKVKVLQEIDDGKIITAGENGVIKVWV